MAIAKTKNNNTAANSGFEAKLWLVAEQIPVYLWFLTKNKNDGKRRELNALALTV